MQGQYNNNLHTSLLHTAQTHLERCNFNNNITAHEIKITKYAGFNFNTNDPRINSDIKITSPPTFMLLRRNLEEYANEPSDSERIWPHILKEEKALKKLSALKIYEINQIITTPSLHVLNWQQSHLINTGRSIRGPTPRWYQNLTQIADDYINSTYTF